MFSQKQLNSFGEALTRKRISQETFDDAVRENVEEFDMQPEEAIESAIEEFKSQGVDLTGVYTGVGLRSHAVYTLSSEVKAHIDSGDVRSLGRSLKLLRDEVDAEADDVSTAILLAANVIELFEPGIKLLSSLSSSAASTTATIEATLEEFLRAYSKFLLMSNALRESFLGVSGATNAKAIPLGHDNVRVVCAALMVAGSLAVQHEAGKAIVMTMDPHDHIIRVLELTRGADEAEFQCGVEAATALIVPLASADDTSQPSSSAFANARKLAQSGVSAALIESLRAVWDGAKEEGAGKDSCSRQQVDAVTCQLCTGLKLLAANDEICKEMVMDMNALGLIFVVLKSGLVALADSRPDMMASVMALLRQMMASDYVKNSIDTTEFMDIVSSNLQMYVDEAYPAASDPGNKVLEHTLGTISALCLRNPDASEAIVDSGCAHLIVTAMQLTVDRTQGRRNGASGQNQGTGKVLRQGCMAVRNIASRSPHVREVLRSYSVVEVIENAKAIAKGACEDVGDAAIRDVTNDS